MYTVRVRMPDGSFEEWPASFQSRSMIRPEKQIRLVPHLDDRYDVMEMMGGGWVAFKKLKSSP